MSIQIDKYINSEITDFYDNFTKNIASVDYDSQDYADDIIRIAGYKKCVYSELWGNILRTLPKININDIDIASDKYNLSELYEKYDSISPDYIQLYKEMDLKLMTILKDFGLDYNNLINNFVIKFLDNVFKILCENRTSRDLETIINNLKIYYIHNYDERFRDYHTTILDKLNDYLYAQPYSSITNSIAEYFGNYLDELANNILLLYVKKCDVIFNQIKLIKIIDSNPNSNYSNLFDKYFNNGYMLHNQQNCYIQNLYALCNFIYKSNYLEINTEYKHFFDYNINNFLIKQFNFHIYYNIIQCEYRNNHYIPNTYEYPKGESYTQEFKYEFGQADLYDNDARYEIFKAILSTIFNIDYDIDNVLVLDKPLPNLNSNYKIIITEITKMVNLENYNYSIFNRNIPYNGDKYTLLGHTFYKLYIKDTNNYKQYVFDDVIPIRIVQCIKQNRTELNLYPKVKDSGLIKIPFITPEFGENVYISSQISSLPLLIDDETEHYLLDRELKYNGFSDECYYPRSLYVKGGFDISKFIYKYLLLFIIIIIISIIIVIILNKNMKISKLI